jgi:anti-sigma factor RsiW
MSCLKIDDIYTYLDGGLSAEERKILEGHLDGCPRCRAALEDRRRLAEAAASLPPIELPADFSRQVMARLLPSQVLVPGWLIALAAVLTPLALLVGIFIRSGENLFDLLSRFGDSVWVFLKNAAVLTAKAFMLIDVAGRLLKPLSQAVFRLLGIVPQLCS